jgi:acetate kinase
MNVLVVNCGSSSLKAAIVDHDSGAKLSETLVERIGEADVADHGVALERALPQLMAEAPDDTTIEAVGHRVVHGGESLTEPTLIDDAVEQQIEDLSELAPLHNPPNVRGIRAARRLLPDLMHVAVFDTAFHSSLPNRAKRYALPLELAEKHGIRRYGFHGTSHRYVAERAAAYLGQPTRLLRLITCHLGNGASLAAIEYGRSVETSMGMTPLEGLCMGTRSGDIDAGVVMHIVRKEKMTIDEIDHLLNRESGLKGLSGVSNDMRDIEERAAGGDERCRLAITVFCHRLRKYIGAYAAMLGGVDAILFTGGIGENSGWIRHRSLQRLEFMGALLDEDINRDARTSAENTVIEINQPHSRVKLLVVATDEQHAIAQDTHAIFEKQGDVLEAPPIPVAVSARHVHLTLPDVAALFGRGYQLTEHAPLGQPGQYVCEERVTLVGPKRSLERVAIIGPCRGQTQVEVSRTDEFHLGLDAPIRCSGKVANTPGITMVGPAGQITTDQGVIQAQRHIHMTTSDAVRYGVSDRDVVEVSIDSGGRDLTFGDVIVRVKDSYKLEMHIDTDEANAADLSSGDGAILMPTTSTATLLRKRVRPTAN